jgi:uncharacterized DUF497 family protein
MFEWDARKAAANASKHGVTFEEAATIFDDPQGLEGPDPQHSASEERFGRIGRSVTGRVLAVGYALRRVGDVQSFRIITARQASRKERRAYAAARN